MNLRNLALLALLAVFLMVTASTFGNGTTQSPLTPEERRGKQIYFYGASPSGEDIVAALGETSLEVPGSVVPCAGCHGAYGRGKTEGGVRPSNLTWESLSKATTAERIHPPYTERALELAITQGRDPAGNKLRAGMPRFQISAKDLSDLIAYLKRLGNDRDPGVSDDKLVIGTILPKGSLAPMGQSIKAVLSAYFTEVNNQGGIYGRRVELKFIETGDTVAATGTAVSRFLKDEAVFALVAAFVAGSEKELASLMDQLEVPLVGPMTLYPQSSDPVNRQVFYLMSGVPEQARAMVEVAVKQAGPAKTSLTVVFPRNELNLSVLDAVAEQCRKKNVDAPQIYDYVTGRFEPVDAAKQVRRSNPTAVIFLGSLQDALAFMKEVEKAAWFPVIYASAAAGGAGIFEAPAGFDGKIFFSFPTSPADQSSQGLSEFRALADKYKFPPTNLAVQVSTYGAAKVLVEGLRVAGKDLRRSQLVRALESLKDYRTELTPPITFGPDRHIGALGAYVVGVDLKNKKYVPAGDWIELK